MMKLLSIKEAADLLGVHPETLRRWDNEGKLTAIKVGDRGDRKYRQEDLLKILSGYKSEDYNDYQILPHSQGFQFSPGTLIRIASFLVVKADMTVGFAFTDGGLLLRMSHTDLKDEVLLEEAKKIIKTSIDNNKIRNLEEYTFEYYPNNYIEIENALWWTKSLKKIYGVVNEDIIELTPGLSAAVKNVHLTAPGSDAWRVILSFKSDTNLITPFGTKSEFTEYYIWISAEYLEDHAKIEPGEEGAKKFALRYIKERFEETKDVNGSRDITGITENSMITKAGICHRGINLSIVNYEKQQT